MLGALLLGGLSQDRLPKSLGVLGVALKAHPRFGDARGTDRVCSCTTESRRVQGQTWRYTLRKRKRPSGLPIPWIGFLLVCMGASPVVRAQTAVTTHTSQKALNRTDLGMPTLR
jgi:hypothetical protein